MKKNVIVFICLATFLVTVCSPARIVHATITDTGGGDMSAITTESAIGTEPEDSSPSNNYEEQMNDIIHQDFVPKVEAEDFFNKIISKMSETMTFGQKAAAFVLAIFFIISAVILAGSALGSHKERVVPSAVGMLIIAIAFVCDIYVMDILGAFSNWIGQ